MKEKKAVKKKTKIFEAYTLLILLATLFMSVGYANISDVKLSVTANITAPMQEGVFISNIEAATKSGVLSEEVKYYKGTTLSSIVNLQDENSMIVYSLSLYNNSADTYYFKGVTIADGAWDNDQYTYELSEEMKPYVSTIKARGDLDFDITFKYIKDATVGQDLSSMIKFEFSNEYIEFAILEEKFSVPTGITWEQFVESEFNTYEFTITDNKIYTAKGKEVYSLSEPVEPTAVIDAEIKYNYKPEIALDNENIELNIQTVNTATITATLKDVIETEAENITWTSSNTDIVEVTNKGKTATITGKTQGFAVITATYGEITAICNVSVKEGYILEFTDSNAGVASNYQIYGNSMQFGTPSPMAQVEIQSVGDLVTDTEDSNYGKYKIPVKVSGKNLIKYPYANATKTHNGITFTDNGDGSITINGTATDLAYLVLNTSVDYGTNIDAMSKNVASNSKYTISKRLFYNASNQVLSINISKGETVNETLYPMLVEGVYTEATMPKYASYVEPITTNIYLDEPLRKIGDYADYIDFETGKVVRKIGRTILNGTENYYIVSSTNTFYTTLPLAANIYDGGMQYCTHFAFTKGTMVDGTFRKSDALYFKKDDVTTIDGFKQWVAEQYSNNTPLTVDYVLTTPTEETINLPELNILEGYTKIEVLTEVSPSNMEVSLPNSNTTTEKKEISFAVFGTTYYAEEGMTWEEWIESSYNTNGTEFDATNGQVLFGAADEKIYLNNEKLVYKSDVIEANGVYDSYMMS